MDLQSFVVYIWQHKTKINYSAQLNSVLTCIKLAKISFEIIISLIGTSKQQTSEFRFVKDSQGSHRVWKTLKTLNKFLEFGLCYGYDKVW